MSYEHPRCGWMQTASGLVFVPAAPTPDTITIGDIAASLSKLCRFGGHCSEFYSVAEHSVLVSLAVPREFALQGLMHDATEAYVVDVPRAVKQMLGDVYAQAEARVWQVIAAKFGLPLALDPSVKRADDAVLLAEKEVLMRGGPTNMPDGWPAVEPADVPVVGYGPSYARDLFLRRFHALTQG